ncbi:MAG: hypothetical protein L3J24_01160 [Xanthomonadales bacterium]|nr:hypothetical protein [Xanthomonadales bacterium]
MAKNLVTIETFFQGVQLAALSASDCRAEYYNFTRKTQVKINYMGLSKNL